jgi:photosystem II stability/assembly factor-like uncharacterized protein
MSKKGRHTQAHVFSTKRSWFFVASLVPMLVVVGWWFTPSQSNAQSESGQAKAISQLNTADFHSLAFSLTEPSTVFFGHHNGLLISRDGGKTWQETALKNADAMALALPLSDPRVMYAAGHDVFVKSMDAGQSWQGVTTNLPSSDIHGFVADSQNAEIVYAHAVGYGIFISENGGTTWQPLWPEAPPSTFNLALGDNETLFAAAGGEGLWRSSDKGQTWQKLSIPTEAAIAVSYEPSHKLLFATLFGNSPGLYSSEDKGTTWRLLLSGNFLAFAVSPQNLDEMLLVDTQGLVFSSHDGGLSW